IGSKPRHPIPEYTARSVRGDYDRLDELKRHAVAFSDCQIFAPVNVLESQGWWQSPHAVRIVPGVLWIGVDLGTSHELKPGPLGQLDNIIFPHVTRGRFWILRHGGVAPMLLDAEDATRPERMVHRLEDVVGVPTVHPVVNVAERQHHIR